MKERPILFNAPMVREVLAGTKTQTRRIGKTQCAEWTELAVEYSIHAKKGKVAVATHLAYPNGSARHGICECPYGIPGAVVDSGHRIGGDRLYVRETWAAPHAYDHLPPRLIPQDARIHYAATEDRGGLLWRPSIHMPRWASRISLGITSVRVERLQDISIEDAKAEGAWGPDDSVVEKVANHFGIHHFDTNPRLAYQMLWEQINGPSSWDANPWVWVLDFKSLP